MVCTLSRQISYRVDWVHKMTELNENVPIPESDTPIYFWLDTEKPYGFLCQYYAANFRDPDVHPDHVFRSAEEYMMYRKAQVIDSRNMPSRVLAETDPAKQKYLVREAYFPEAKRKIWERIKFDVVVDGNFCKFRQNPELRSQLLATGDRPLVEASSKDKIWGIGFAAEDAGANEALWGTNLLGQALRVVRDELRSKESV